MVKGIHYTLDVRFKKDMAQDMKDLLQIPIKGFGFLNEITKRINMTPILGPFVEKFQSDSELESGVSGFIIFAESHASMHTYPERNYMALDVFSCKEFEISEVVGLLKDMSGDSIDEIYLQYLDRGEALFET